MVDLSLSEGELEERRERITAFIARTVEEAGATGAVLGLSGGIDSSLTAALAVEALGPDRLTGLSMPTAVSAEAHQSDAAALAERLDISFAECPVEDVVSAVVAASPTQDVGEFARGNARARSRAVLSYLIANEEGLVVLGTGNRTEALVGYFTKFGDGAVDCNPIGNLYKCQVRQLARHAGLPDRLVDKTPTAELWADQTDEAELGIEYDTLDRILALHVDGPLSKAATARELGIDGAVIEHVEELVATSAHKREMPPAPPT